MCGVLKTAARHGLAEAARVLKRGTARLLPVKPSIIGTVLSCSNFKIHPLAEVQRLPLFNILGNRIPHYGTNRMVEDDLSTGEKWQTPLLISHRGRSDHAPENTPHFKWPSTPCGRYQLTSACKRRRRSSSTTRPSNARPGPASLIN